jgi:kynureninase
MSHSFTPASGAGALQIGTPNILSMAPLLGTLEMMRNAGIERIREKSLRLTDYLISLVERELTAYGFRIATPRESARRGGHIALLHPEAIRICKALRKERVVPDYRPPEIVRLAPVALYTSFGEVYQAILRLKNILQTESYREFPTDRGVVP